MATNPDVEAGKKATQQTNVPAPNPYYNPYASQQQSAGFIGDVTYQNQIPDVFTLMFGPQVQGLRYSRYFEGYQYEPYNWGTDQVSSLQARLKAAGLTDGYIPGVWAPEDSNAYAKVLAWANANGVSWEEALSGLAETGGLRSGGGGGLGPAPITDDDVRAIANKTAQSVIGRALREDEMSSFMPAFRASYYSGTSPATAAETTVRQETAPVEAGGYGMGQVMGAIDQILRGGSVR